MTVEEALQIANNMARGYEGCGFDKDPQYSQQYECYKVAIEALEKQIPKERIDDYNENGRRFSRCPICKLSLESHDVIRWVTYCPECGQRLER